METRLLVAVVTGGYGVIGRAIAAALARQGIDVVLVGRNERALVQTAAELERETEGSVRTECCDLSRKAEVEALGARWSGPLHILVNNAATCPRSRTETPDGLEMQFAVNVLGYQWMLDAFERTLAESAPSRVVNVASYWAGDLEVDDLQFVRRRYDNDTAYRQSKQANRMLTVAWAERLKLRGITVNACHPSDVPSKVARDLGFGGSDSPEGAAATPVWLATDPSVKKKTGAYFAHQREERCRFAQDRAAVAALQAACDPFR